MQNTCQPAPPEGYRQLAWNGISFAVPQNWEIAVFRFLRRGASRVELEDEYTIRMEAEWIFSDKQKLDVETIMKRYEAASKPLTLKAEDEEDVTGLPEGWYATHFMFKETGKEKAKGKLEVVSHGLVTAFYLCPQKSLFCFFLVHFMPEDPEDPVATIHKMAHTFTNHRNREFIPRQLFDMSFKLPRDFKLEKTDFDIGMKMMRFKWKARRFSLWHFSCANMFLRDGITPAEWIAGYLNGYGGFRGPRFDPDGKGDITWRRRKPHIFGHRSEIAHWCFKYRIGWRLTAETNQLIVWVFQYRKAADLEILPEYFQSS